MKKNLEYEMGTAMIEGLLGLDSGEFHNTGELE